MTSYSSWTRLGSILPTVDISTYIPSGIPYFRDLGWRKALTMENSESSNTSLSLYEPVYVAAGVGTVALIGVGLKSLVKMGRWQASLRDEETKGRAPGPAPLPILGNVIPLRRNYYKCLYDYVDRPASVFWVMSTPFVVVNYEEGLRRVLGGAGGKYMKPKYFGYRSKAVKSAVHATKDKVAEESIEYKDDGDTSRVALENMIKESLGTITESMEKLLLSLEEASREEDKKKHSEDSHSFVRQAIVGLNLKVLFGLNSGCPNAEDPVRISSMIDFAGTEFAKRMVNPLKVFVDILGNFQYAQAVGGLIQLGRRLCKLLDDCALSAAVETPSGTAEQSGSASGLSWVHAWVGKVGRIGKLGKVVGLLMASTQTVPLTAVWMLHLVGRDGAIRDRLRAELEHVQIRCASDITHEKLASMELADAVIKETLRMYPPFPLIQREAQENDTLGGITIPQGTIVYVVPWLVHRNPEYWKDAHDFQPDRFLTNNKSHGDAPSDWVYIPFGRGARMCAGSKLAIAELKVLLTLAMLSYQWESTSEADAKDGRFPELGMVPKGIKLRVKRMDKVELSRVVATSQTPSTVIM